MFIPKCFEMSERSQQQQFIRDFGFGIIVSDTLGGIHLPFVLQEKEGTHGTLYTHCARENPHWQTLEGKDVLVIFTGPHSYISPSWYRKGPAVPTWNYAAVHAYGKVSLLDDDTTLASLDSLVSQYEPELLVSRDILTDRIKARLLPAIVGFTVELSKLEGKLKLGQQRSLQDQQGVYQALKQSNNIEDRALAEYMSKIGLGTGK